MTQTKHTPGPWTAMPSPDDNGVVLISDFKSICEVHNHTDTASDTTAAQREFEANARLIAAAPDLLAALQWIAQEIEWGHDMRASLAVAQQAIRKATGGEE